ncbi:molybdopterin-binding protein [Frondihabitans peucedani]|uniref:Molybdopterin molybdenumtransferase n=1 Tax=Frondihabitans peucedani TaxID=598626 RepID=A0ABP8E610_9MICO
MRTIEEHRKTIAELVAGALATRRVVVRRVSEGVSGEVLADDVVAPLDLPPFANSQMDGYAVVASDLEGGAARLAVGRRIPAGHVPAPLTPGTAAPIMTGAALPDGADAVVQIERADPPRFQDEGGASTVSLPGPVPVGQFVRAVGSDVRRGDTLLRAGTVLRGPHYGILASSGVESVRVLDAPVVLLVSTGSELAAEPGPLGGAAIHDANGASLRVALEEADARVIVRRVADDGDALLRLARLGVEADSADLVVTTGGVSEGAYEVVRETFAPRGVEFGSVAMQPGGPQGWGVLDLGGRSVPVVAFPGNPVSALISFEMFLREPLQRAAGRPVQDRDRVAILSEGADSPPGKHQIRRGRLDPAGRVVFVGGPGSHLLHSYALATHLVHLPVGISRVEAGDEVVVWPLDD